MKKIIINSRENKMLNWKGKIATLLSSEWHLHLHNNILLITDLRKLRYSCIRRAGEWESYTCVVEVGAGQKT